jgi:hypothetical protein
VRRSRPSAKSCRYTALDSSCLNKKPGARAGLFYA